MVKAVEEEKGEAWAAFPTRRGDRGRDMVLYIAREKTGMTLRELGQAAGGMDYAALSEAVLRLNRRLKKDAALRNALHRTEVLLIV